MAKRVIIRNAKGEIMPASERYSKEAKTVQVMRRGRYVTIIEEGNVTPEKLAELTTREEFESFPPAFVHLKDFKSKKKYRAWDISEQIDKVKGMRRKLLKVTMSIRDGKRLRKVFFYQKINRNAKSSYRTFQRMNEAIGFEGMHLYKTAGGKLIADRRGKKVTLESVSVEEVI